MRKSNKSKPAIFCRHEYKRQLTAIPAVMSQAMTAGDYEAYKTNVAALTRLCGRK